MSSPLIILSQNASVLDAMKLMYEQKIRRIIILKENTFLGIVTELNKFKLLMGNKELVTTVMSNDFPIPQKDLYKDFSPIWFSNSFYK
jgi:predicted transcriptional regulator